MFEMINQFEIKLVSSRKSCLSVRFGQSKVWTAIKSRFEMDPIVSQVQMTNWNGQLKASSILNEYYSSMMSHHV